MMDSLTLKHIGYLETYLSTLSSHNSNWSTSDKTPKKYSISDSSNFLTLLQQHHPQIISEEKQKEESSDICPPVNIIWTPEGGRHLVASHDVTAGEVLFWEPPLLMAPKAGGGPTCLNCLRKLPEDFSSCAQCGAPLCVPHCDGCGHTTTECQAFKAGLKDFGQESQAKQELDSNNDVTCSEDKTEEYNQNRLKKVKLLNCMMTPLRTLLLMQDSSSASDVIGAMQSNAEQRSKMPIGKFLESQFLNPLRKCLGVQLPGPVLQHACGIWDTNAFEMRISHGGVGRGLLPIAGLMNHSCVPNTQHWTYRGGLMVMAATEIPKGSPLTNNYVNTFMGNIPRQSHLLTTKLFVCRCPRCTDPTELGSNASALPCQECKSGLIQPPQDGKGNWKCDNCTEDLPYERVCMLVQMSGKMITTSHRLDLKGKRSMFTKLRKMLGEQHYLTKELQVVVLGDILQQPIQDVNIQELKSALGIVKDLMKYIDLIEPGYTKFKGLFILRHLQITAELIKRSHCDNRTLTSVLADEVTELAAEVTPDAEDHHTDVDIHKSNQQDLKALVPLVSDCSGILQYDDVLCKELQEVTQKLQDLQTQFDTTAPALGT